MKRKRGDIYEGDNPDRWLVSYADFITLMFAFFTVLYATSDVNLEKGKEFEESVQKYLVKFGAAGGSGAEVSQGIKENSPIDQPIKTYQIGKGDTRDTLEKTELFIEEKLLEGKGKSIIQDIVAVEEGVRVTLYGPAVFAQNSVKFKAEALAPLDDLGRFLRSLGKKLVIESHLEQSVFANSTYVSAWEFAAGRSTTFVRYLIRRFNYPPDKLAAVSYGSERPIFPPDDQENFLKNQRIDILILTE